MKNSAIRVMSVLMALMMLAGALASCNNKPLEPVSSDDQPTSTEQISGDIFNVLASGQLSVVGQENTFDIYLPNETAILELRHYVEVAKGVSWMISKDIGMQNPIVNKVLELQEGLNVFYVYCYTSDESVAENYVLNIHRSGSYLVTFEGITETQTVVDGNFATQPTAVPTKEGYSFDGWNFDFTKPVTASVSVQAKWTPRKYVVTYDPNLGSVTSKTQTVTYGEEVTLLVPVRDGFLFADWFYGDERIRSGVWTIASDVTLCAEWASDSYTVTFDANGGSMEGATVITVTYGSAVTFPIPTKEGFTFGGWYDGQTLCFDGTYEYTKDLNLVAKWNERSATLVFSANGGIVSVETGKPSVELTLPFGGALPTPIREGFTFGGWFSDEELTKQVTAVPDESMRLYAWWTEEGKPGEFIYEKSGLSYKVTARVDRESGAVVPAYIGGKKTVDAIPLPNPNAGVVLENENLQVKVDRKTTIFATFVPKYEGDDMTLTFKSSRPSIAVVDENGVVTGKKPGLCPITIENPATGINTICVVNVESTEKDPNAGITVEPISARIYVGDILTLNVTYVPEYFDDDTTMICALMTGEGIVSLEEGMTVKALSVGNATISVSDSYGTTAIVSIEVISLPEPSLTVDKTEITIVVGSEDTIIPSVYPMDTVLVWTSDAEAVATVSDGVIRGITTGKCTVTVSSSDGTLTATVTVIVTPVQTLTVDKTEVNLPVNGEETVTVACTLEGAVILWDSDDPAVATIENGVIKALKVGECTLTASTTDGALSATVKVTVTEVTDGIDPTVAQKLAE